VQELFSGSARVSSACADNGLRVAAPIDLRTGFDLAAREGQKRAWNQIEEQQPTVVFMAPLCSPWSSLSNATPEPQRSEKRRASMPLVLFCHDVAWHQIKHGRFFIIENPQSSAMWNLEDMLKLAASPGVTWVTSQMCSFGLKDPMSHMPMKKAMSFFHSFPLGILHPL